jgi:hypothetical protein
MWLSETLQTIRPSGRLACAEDAAVSRAGGLTYNDTTSFRHGKNLQVRRFAMWSDTERRIDLVSLEQHVTAIPTDTASRSAVLKEWGLVCVQPSCPSGAERRQRVTRNLHTAVAP